MKLPLWVRALVLAGGALLLWTAARHHNEAMREEGRLEIRAQVATQAAAEIELNAKETQRRLARQKENDDAAAALLAALVADRARLRASADGMRDHIADLEQLARSGASCDPSTEGQREAAGAAAGMLAELQRRADERAGILADYADRARIAGEQCEADYDALTRTGSN